MYPVLGSDNLARCGALESLVNDVVDDTWDDRAMNRISAIHFLDDNDDEDDEKVRWSARSVWRGMTGGDEVEKTFHH